MFETNAEHDGVYTTSPAADVKLVSTHGAVSHVNNTTHPTCGAILTLYALQPGQENASDAGSQPDTSDKLIPVTLIPASPMMDSPANALPNSLWGAPSKKLEGGSVGTAKLSTDDAAYTTLSGDEVPQAKPALGQRFTVQYRRDRPVSFASRGGVTHVMDDSRAVTTQDSAT